MPGPGCRSGHGAECGHLSSELSKRRGEREGKRSWSRCTFLEKERYIFRGFNLLETTSTLRAGKEVGWVVPALKLNPRGYRSLWLNNFQKDAIIICHPSISSPTLSPHPVQRYQRPDCGKALVPWNLAGHHLIWADSVARELLSRSKARALSVWLQCTNSKYQLRHSNTCVVSFLRTHTTRASISPSQPIPPPSHGGEPASLSTPSSDRRPRGRCREPRKRPGGNL